MPSTLSLAVASVIRSRSLNETRKTALETSVVRRSKSDASGRLQTVAGSPSVVHVPPSPQPPQIDVSTG